MESDPDTIMAYYCFVNRNWAPSQYLELPERERLLVSLFAKKEAEERDKRLKK